MMDQNRCLLDVIDNPQLLQSFLESESNAETNNNPTNTTTTNAIQTTASATTGTSYLPTQTTNCPSITETTETATYEHLTSPTLLPPTITDTTDPNPQPIILNPPEIVEQTPTTTSSATITTEALAPATVSSPGTEVSEALIVETILPSAEPAPTISTPTVETKPTTVAVTLSPQAVSSPQIVSSSYTTEETAPSIPTNAASIPTNAPLISTIAPPLTTAANPAVDSLSLEPPTLPITQTPVTSIATTTISTADPATAPTSVPSIETAPTPPASITVAPSPPALSTATTTTPTVATITASPSAIVTTLTTALGSTSTPPTITTSTTTITTSSTTTPTTASQVPTTTKAPTKRAPKKNTTPRAPKGKNAKTAANQSPGTPQPPTSMATQYATLPGQQQQIMYQANNGGIRQPTMMSPSPIRAPIGGLPQQQRVIQIQTANGPMYFAIAPGPAMGPPNSPMMNQQPGMQSQQYPSQQICFQPNSTVMINRPPMTQSQPQQPPPPQSQPPPPQQQQQQPQQQHMVLPTSQPMMMPRMSNQLILNRPMNQPGQQLLPGQQQFIQIQTPNGPMLLALPSQQSQPQNNNTMIDYNNQAQQQQSQHQHMQMQMNGSANDIKPTTTSAIATGPVTTSSKAVSNNSKSGLDLADLLLDCGILPEERKTAAQSPSNIRNPQPTTLQQINSPMPTTMTQMNSQMPPMDSPSMPINSSQQQNQSIPNFTGQHALQQQPIRITIGPDGQMMMQPTVYGAIRPVLTNVMGQTHMNSVPANSIVPSSSPMMSNLNSSPNYPNNEIITPESKKPDGKSTATKRSRSKKSDIDKFPTLKTPKIAQQQQQQQQQQQKMQAVTVVPMTVLVGDQNKVLATAGPDVKTNVAQIAGTQQVSLTKIVTPVMQTTTSLQPIVNSNLIQTSFPSTNVLAATIGQSQLQGTQNCVQNTQIQSSDSGNSISIQGMSMQQQQQNFTANTVTSTLCNNNNNSSITSTTSQQQQQQMSSSGNFTTNSLQRVNNTGTVESNPHISSSLMPTLSLPIDSLKNDQSGLKTTTDGQQIQQQQQVLINNANQATIRTIQSNTGGLTTATLVIHQTQVAHQTTQNHQNSQQINQLNQVQQLPRPIDIRAQSILHQLGADQNAALNPQTKQSFKSFEDACKRLLRYHVFDADPVSEAKIKKVDDIFDAAAESLISRKNAIYDKYRFLILKQSMKSVPLSEEVMLEQLYVNEEHAFLKKEREMFREYEAYLESLALEQARTDSTKVECAPEFFGYGENHTPKHSNSDDLDSATHSRDVDDWLMPDKWGNSSYPGVPDSEAATAIESILNEELS